MKKKNQDNIKKFMTIILTALITFTVTTLWLYGRIENKEVSKDEESNQNEKIIGKALDSDALTTKLKVIKDKINSNFIGDVDEDKLKEYAIKGYIAGLDDEYSAYYTKEEMEELTEETLGNYVGIGVYMTEDKEAGYVRIHEVMKDSPAEKAGVQAGDLIKNVDGTEVTAEDFKELPSMVKGKEGTTVKMTFIRNGEEIKLDIVRKSIIVKNVEGKVLNNNIGYIYISSFEGDVSKQFKEEYDKLKSEGINSLIIDLRNNGGGIVDEAVEIGDYFTNKGEKLLIQSDKNGNEENTMAKSDKEISLNTVLLVNGYSASASEILAGIFKDKVDNSKIVGTTTYGKGVIQSLYSLSDGSGLKITTNEYYTPNHSSINKTGIEPDIEVSEKDGYTFNGDLDEENDVQLEKAKDILKNNLQ